MSIIKLKYHILLASFVMMASVIICAGAPSADKEKVAEEIAAKAKTASAKVAKLATARAEIARIKQFKGKAVVLSSAKMRKITKVGQPLLEGDRVQTEDGEVEIEFKDGAILKVNPYTTIGVEERTETSGMLLWKKKEDVRRVTCFVGKLWYKSGKGERKNYVQTPTAVCALRGTTLELGTDGKQSYLDMIDGAAKTVGEVLRRACPDFGKDPALANAIYQTVANAVQLVENAEGGMTAQQATAAAVQATQQALGDSPDPMVAQYAQAATAALAAQIVAINAQVQAEQAMDQLNSVMDDPNSTPEDVQAAMDAASEAVNTFSEASGHASDALDALEQGNLDDAIGAAEEAADLVSDGDVGIVDDDPTMDEAEETMIETLEAEIYEGQ